MPLYNLLPPGFSLKKWH